MTLVQLDKDPITDDFNKEQDLSDYIMLNIEKFTNEILEDEFISAEENKPILKRHNFGARGKRVDIYIIGKQFNHIVELKNPINPAANKYGIGQLLDYARELRSLTKETKLILLTTKYDTSTAKTIKHFNLPIRYVFFSKDKVMEYIKDAR